MRKIAQISLAATAALLLSACGGGGENWGIDHGNGTPLAKCVNNAQDAAQAKAVTVPAGTVVRKLSDSTVLRVWHFQNSVEAACVVSGEALLVAGGQS